jgi:hypothetical protein
MQIFISGNKTTLESIGLALLDSCKGRADEPAPEFPIEMSLPVLDNDSGANATLTFTNDDMEPSVNPEIGDSIVVEVVNE